MRRATRFLLLALLTLTLLEFVLQALSVFVWMSKQRTESATGAEKASVLCVGDSYTFGIGASTPQRSYPSRLQERLVEALHEEVKVVNAGWPGQDSRDVLTTLGDRIRSCSPRVVCVLVGCNDRWNRPQLADPESLGAATGYRFRWRTWRLLQLLLRGFGVLHESLPEPDQPPTAAMVESATALIREAGISVGKQQAEYPPALAADSRLQVDESRKALENRDYRAALKIAQGVLEKGPCLPALALAAMSHVKLGESEDAMRFVRQLRDAHAQRPSIETFENLGQALNSIGSADEQLQLLKSGVEQFPLAIGLWNQLAAAVFVRDVEAAAVPFQRCLELSPRIEVWSKHQVSALGRTLAKSKPAQAAMLLSAALLLEGQARGHVWGCYQVASSDLKSEQFSSLFTFQGIDDRGRRLLREAHAEVFGSGAKQWHAVLKSHLDLIADVVQAGGAKPVFLWYPFKCEGESALLAAADERHLDLLPMRYRFEKELETKVRADLFVSDGHCNDAGYAVMAEEVAKVVSPMLRK
jgi:lysophospholipase L1-like esterase